jgi:uncharacterized membrane protein
VALRALRILALAIAGGAILALVAITLGIPAALGVRLVRFREPTWVLWGALALFAVSRGQPRAYLRDAAANAGSILGSAPFFMRMAAASLGFYLLVSIRVHLSFHTFSHDFSIFDESLWWSHHGRFLYSPVLGRGYLTEHFSPILAALVPVHALFPSPFVLVAANALLLWAAVFPLRALLDSLDLPRATRNLACLVYLANPITTAALDYGFHVEAFLPVVVFGLYAAHRLGRAWAYGALLVAALAIKEDVGLYLVGLGAFLFLAEKRCPRGIVTAAAGLAWSLLVLAVITPRLAGGAEEYRFLSRWEAWGHGRAGVLAGMASHPVTLLVAVATATYVLFFYRLLFTPFFSRWGWTLFAIPWVVGATSGSRPQATLGLYYGLPLLSFAAIAAAHGLASGEGKRIRGGAWAPTLAALAVALNVAHFTIQPIPPERAALLAALKQIPPDASVQAMPALYTVLPYERSKTVLMPEDSLNADYVALRSDTTAWPFSREQVERLAEGAIASGTYEARFFGGTFLLLRRRHGSS